MQLGHSSNHRRGPDAARTLGGTHHERGRSDTIDNSIYAELDRTGERDLRRARILYCFLFLVVFLTGLALVIATPFITATQ
jgi:hypothetical protein